MVLGLRPPAAKPSTRRLLGGTEATAPTPSTASAVTGYERLPDDNASDVFAWARGKDPQLHAGVAPPLWLHGPHMTRPMAEAVLFRHGATNGLFLVRERPRKTDDSPASFAFSMAVNKRVEHRLIKRGSDGFYSLAGGALPPVDNASDVSAVLVRLASKAGSAGPRRAVVIPRLGREDVGGLPDFFHGPISRRLTNVRLALDGQLREGAYLVRQSRHEKPTKGVDEALFVLSVVHSQTCYHHLLRFVRGTWILNDSVRFPSSCQGLADVLAELMHPRLDVNFVLTSYVRAPPRFRAVPFDPLAGEDLDAAARRAAREPAMATEDDERDAAAGEEALRKQRQRDAAAEGRRLDEAAGVDADADAGTDAGEEEGAGLGAVGTTRLLPVVDGGRPVVLPASDAAVLDENHKYEIFKSI